MSSDSLQLTLSLTVASPTLTNNCRTHGQEMESVAGLGLYPRFRYEENMGFPSERQEQFAKIRQYFSLLAYTFTDSFTDSGRAYSSPAYFSAALESSPFKMTTVIDTPLVFASAITFFQIVSFRACSKKSCPFQVRRRIMNATGFRDMTSPSMRLSSIIISKCSPRTAGSMFIVLPENWTGGLDGESTETIIPSSEIYETTA